MKGFYFSAAIFFTVLILIVAFENLNALLNKWMFLFIAYGQYDGFFLVIEFTFIGSLIGVFGTLFLSQLQHTDEEEPGAETF